MKKSVRASRRCRDRNRNAIRPDAGSQQMAAVRFGQIQMALLAGFAGFPLREERRKLAGYVPADLIAAFTNARAQGSAKIDRNAAKLLGHLFDRALHDLRSRPAPARVHGSHRAALRIQQQNRNAIGRSDTNAAPWLIGNQRVALALAGMQAVSVPDTIGMNLAQRNVRRRIAQARPEAMRLPTNSC